MKFSEGGFIHGPGSGDFKPPTVCGCDGRGQWNERRVISLGEIRVPRATFDKFGAKTLVALSHGDEFTKIVVVEPDGTETHL
jgi:hypothetical protein